MIPKYGITMNQRNIFVIVPIHQPSNVVPPFDSVRGVQLSTILPVDFGAAVDLADGGAAGDEDEVEEPAAPVEEAHDAKAAVRVRVVAVLGPHALELVLVLKMSLEF